MQQGLSLPFLQNLNTPFISETFNENCSPNLKGHVSCITIHIVFLPTLGYQ